MPPRKVARKVTQQPIKEQKHRRTEKKEGRKREKRKEKEMVKASSTTAPKPLAGTQNVESMNTDEHTEMEEPAISSSQSLKINVNLVFVDINFSKNSFVI